MRGASSAKADAHSILAKDGEVCGFRGLQRVTRIGRQRNSDDKFVAVFVAVCRRGPQLVALLLEAARLELVANESWFAVAPSQVLELGDLGVLGSTAPVLDGV